VAAAQWFIDGLILQSSRLKPEIIHKIFIEVWGAEVLSWFVYG
jgi:hypothetical protein